MTTPRRDPLRSPHFARARACAVAAAVAAISLPALPQASGATTVVPGGALYVQSAVNGLNASDSSGSLALHRPKGDEDHQQWTAVAVPGGHELRSTDDAAHCLGRSGAEAAVVACGGANAVWQVAAADPGAYALGVPGTADRLALGAAPAGGVYPERPQIGADGPLARWYLTPAPLPQATMPPADQRTLDQVTFLTAHNAYANGVDGGFAPPFVNFFPNQSRGISQQLDDGVRGFMMDIHQTPDGAILCHDSCTLVSRPVALWVDVQRMVDFLKQHPGEFATVFLEDYVSADVLRAELARVDGLQDVLYRPDQDGVREHGWPRMADLAARGKQLMLFTDRTRAADSGGPTRDSFGVMYQQEWTVENYWSMGSGAGSSDWACYSRWYGSGVNVPLTREEPGFHPLFVMNHFRDTTLSGTAATDNGKLLNRVRNFCEPAARKKPTYVAVDRYDLGSPQSAVDRLNGYTVVP
ncbi:PI-PLC domain-containing protein [Streptomyces sp. NPDC088354]|uniref:PI-PLC domain-containing protein n=1 Tax=Streptomyces sp. NPDC088354 TaxID=3365856 RepID=UPI00381333D6